MSGFGSPKIRNAIIVAIAIFVLVISAAYLIQSSYQFNEHASVYTQTSLNSNFTTDFPFDISINYNGSWRLVYWGLNGTTNDNHTVYCIECGSEIEYNVMGNLTGSGNYNTQLVTYGVGYVTNTLCVNAKRLGNSPQNQSLTLAVAGTTNSTTDSNPTVQVCSTYGV